MRKYYVGLDVHSKKSAFVIEDEGGKVIARGEVPTTPEGFWGLQATYHLYCSRFWSARPSGAAGFESSFGARRPRERLFQFPDRFAQRLTEVGELSGTRCTRDQAPMSEYPTMTLPIAIASLRIRSARVFTPTSAAVATPKRSISGSRVPAISAINCT
jgi:hypothetical protein